VVGAWWSGFAVQDGQSLPLTSPREYMDLKVDPKQVKRTHLLQWLHWIKVCQTSLKQTKQGYLGD